MTGDRAALESVVGAVQAPRGVSRRRLRAVVIGGLTCALCLAAAPTALASVGISAMPVFATTLTVGDTAPASLQITNSSTGAEAAGPVTLCGGPSGAVQTACSGDSLPSQSLRLTPACGSTTGPDCPAGFEDPGVFAVSSTGTGEAGTACAGVTFTVSTSNAATGQVEFVPSGTVVLQAPGAAGATSLCFIDFTILVAKVPTHPLGGVAGMTAQLAFAAGVSNINGNGGSGGVATSATVDKATPSLATQVAPTPIALGAAFHDTATLGPPAGAATPTGTVTFNVYPPTDSTCTSPPVLSSTNGLNAAGTSATSGNFTPGTAGTYRVIATYSGDANYAPVTSPCAASTEAVVVNKPTLTISTAVSPTAIALGGSFGDTATLGAPPAGGATPTGTVTFNVYAPTDSFCGAGPVFTSTNALNAAGTSATSVGFTPTAAGTYRVIATYSGDANYGPVASVCADPTEAVAVSLTTLSLSTVASIGAGSFSDVATLGAPPAGSPTPTGTVTFSAYGPVDSTCAAPPAFTSTNALNAAGTSAMSSSFAHPAPGKYLLRASYSGDANYAPVTSACVAPNESVDVPAPMIAVTKTASPATRVEPGGNFTFTVTGSNPSATDPITITSLVDNVYGDLATLPGSTCGALIGVTLAPGATSPPCTFTGPFNGVGGDSQTDTVTATGVDSFGTTATATAAATVSLTSVAPMISVTKSASPSSESEPGGPFTFTVQVSNPSATDPITITSLVDNVYGSLATRVGSTCGALIGVTLAPSATSAPCTFKGSFTGTAGASQTDTVTASGVDSFGHTATATAMATVTITGGADLSLTKTASPSPVIAGQQLTYTLTAANAGPQTATSAKIVDTLPGGATFAGASAGCTDSGGTVTCQLGDLAVGASATRTIVVVAPAGGVTNTATVSSVLTDPNPGNNTAIVSTAVTSSCASTLTGAVRRSIVVASGQFVCVSRGKVSGSITVRPGGGLTVSGGSVVGGAVLARGAAFVTLCGSTFDGAVSIRDSSLMVRVGDDDTGCAGNSLLGALTLTGNAGGLEVFGNTIHGAASITRNHGVAPPAADAVPEIEGNTAPTLLCSGNAPAPVDDGVANHARVKTGQCRTL